MVCRRSFFNRKRNCVQKYCEEFVKIAIVFYRGRRIIDFVKKVTISNENLFEK